MNIITRIESLRAAEHAATVALIEALVECDRTQAHVALGYGSLWDFLVRHLRYSNAAASRRYKAMKCVRDHPEALSLLGAERTNLSVLAMVESELSKASDAERLLETVCDKSQREVERVLAQRNPTSVKREVVRREVVSSSVPPAADLFSSSAAEVASHAEPEERVHLSFRVSAATFDDLERAKAILSRKLPQGVTLEQAFEEMLAFYLKHKAPKERKKASPPRVSAGSRHIPVAVRDEVLLRDGGRCTFRGPGGQQCGRRHDVEVDHIRPFALGGGHEPGNLRLLCSKHNRFRAKETLGEAVRKSTGTGITVSSGSCSAAEGRTP